MAFLSDLALVDNDLIYDEPDTEVQFFNYQGIPCVKKTVKSFLGSSLLAKKLCEREVKILERVRGLKGVQQLVEQDSPNSFISRYERGTSLRYAGQIPEDYFTQLSDILRQIHSRGVADIDFAHSTDLLVTKEGQPVVIDLASAVIYDSSKPTSMFIKPIFDYICDLNKKYILRRKMRFLPELTKEQDIDKARLDFLSESWRRIRSQSKRSH